MKDLTEDHKVLFGNVSVDNTLERVQVALDFLWKERHKSIHDKVAGDFDYEELIGVLLHAEKSELERQELIVQYDRLVERYNNKD